MTGLQIRFSGSGGQGLQLAAKILGHAAMLDGKSIAFSQAYEPTARGGLSRADLIVGGGEIDYPLVTALDYVVILDDVAVTASDGLLSSASTALVDVERVTKQPGGGPEVVALRLIGTAREAGNVRAANIVSLGALAARAGIAGHDCLVEAIRQSVRKEFVAFNLEALERGRALLEAPAEKPAPLGACR
ncbi:MAG: hypothetical protein MAG794_00758 [Gammaproteobacteria bacterium]|nr:hypothetical protein [Gammaproteobacteria bacterium]